MSLHAVLIAETLYSIIHAKYISFQLTNCQALEISSNAVPPAGHRQLWEGISSPVVLIHSDLKGVELSKYLREQNELL